MKQNSSPILPPVWSRMNNELQEAFEMMAGRCEGYGPEMDEAVEKMRQAVMSPPWAAQDFLNHVRSTGTFQQRKAARQLWCLLHGKDRQELVGNDLALYQDGWAEGVERAAKLFEDKASFMWLCMDHGGEEAEKISKMIRSLVSNDPY